MSEKVQTMGLQQAADQMFESELLAIRTRTDRFFAALMVAQLCFAVFLALFVSPQTWAGIDSWIHPHVGFAVLLGGAVSLFPVYLALKNPGQFVTRCTIAVAQVLTSTLLIHLTGGRIETHFHVFGSLAFLAFYRDNRVLLLATSVVAVDHLLRGALFPQSVFGVATASAWRSLEHAGWVLFEVTFLFRATRLSLLEMKAISYKHSQVQDARATVEKQVEERTQELEERTHDLEQEMRQRQVLEGQLLNAQKMESVGHLAAGVAHEINSPMQYIGDFSYFLQDSIPKLFKLIESEHAQIENSPDLDPDQKTALLAKLDTLKEDMNLDFLQEQMPQALAESLEGIQKVSEIVSSMKSFADPGSGFLQLTNIRATIENVVTVTRNEWKFGGTVDVQFPEDFPDVPVFRGEFNQAVLNLVTNAAHAIRDAQESGALVNSPDHGSIIISGRVEEDRVIIEVKDNGIGISEENRDKVFDPYFTTRDVGEGRGQGLAITYDLITNKHHGSIWFDSTEGKGTTFTLSLLIDFKDHPGHETPVGTETIGAQGTSRLLRP